LKKNYAFYLFINISKKNTRYIYFSIHNNGLEGGDLPLTRKTRLSGSSIVVTIPSQLVEAYNIHSGDPVEIIPLENGEIRIRKIKKQGSQEGAV
jgi:hypothetical protein